MLAQKDKCYHHDSHQQLFFHHNVVSPLAYLLDFIQTSFYPNGAIYVFSRRPRADSIPHSTHTNRSALDCCNLPKGFKESPQWKAEHLTARKDGDCFSEGGKRVLIPPACKLPDVLSSGVPMGLAHKAQRQEARQPLHMLKLLGKQQRPSRATPLPGSAVLTKPQYMKMQIVFLVFSAIKGRASPKCEPSNPQP